MPPFLDALEPLSTAPAEACWGASGASAAAPRRARVLLEVEAGLRAPFAAWRFLQAALTPLMKRRERRAWARWSAAGAAGGDPRSERARLLGRWRLTLLKLSARGPLELELVGGLEAFDPASLALFGELADLSWPGAPIRWRGFAAPGAAKEAPAERGSGALAALEAAFALAGAAAWPEAALEAASGLAEAAWRAARAAAARQGLVAEIAPGRWRWEGVNAPGAWAPAARAAEAARRAEETFAALDRLAGGGWLGTRFRLARRAGETAHAAALAERALQGALETYDLACARAALSDLASLLGELAPAWRSRYAFWAAEIARVSGEGARALAAYEALDLAALPPRFRARARVGAAIAEGMTGALRPAAARLEAALEGELEGPEAVRARLALARTWVRAGEEARALAPLGAVLAESGASLAQQAEAWGLLGLARLQAADARPEEALSALARSGELARLADDRLALATAAMLEGNAHLGLGRLAEAEAAFTLYRRACDGLGIPDETLCAELNLAAVELERGRVGAAFGRAAAAADASARLGNRAYAAYGHALAGRASTELGRFAEAEARLAEAAALAPDDPEVAFARATSLVFMQRLGEAEAVWLAQAEPSAGSARWLGLRARALALAGCYAEAAGLYAAALALAPAERDAAGHATWLAERAGVALLAGQLGMAGAQARAALALATACGACRARRAALAVCLEASARAAGRAAPADLPALEAAAAEAESPDERARLWEARARRAAAPEEASAWRARAAVVWRFYLAQLPPLAATVFGGAPHRVAGELA